jgi:hypothetical protein
VLFHIVRGYFFRDVVGTKTFDLYRKYKIHILNFHKCDVADEQWAYAREIELITQEQYETGHA